MIVRYNIIILILKTGQKLSLVIIDGCLHVATRQHGLICHTWYNKTITKTTRLSILENVIALPGRHDVSIYGFIENTSNTKVYYKSSFYILKNQNKETWDKQLS